MALRPPAPFSGQLSANPQDQMRQVAEALSRKMDVTLEPTYSAVMLLAPDGSAWRLSVDASGALSTMPVPRT